VGGGVIKINLREIGWDGMDWIDLAQDRDPWQALVNTVMNLRVPWSSLVSLVSYNDNLRTHFRVLKILHKLLAQGPLIFQREIVKNKLR
jgi:hypothetical protein